MPDIKALADPALRRRIKQRKHVAILPVGSMEQHGPHLPISTDSDIVTEVSRRLADRMNLLLLPTLNYGVSFEHAPLFQLSLRVPTMRRVIEDVCASLANNGLDRILIINGHHGNIGALRGIDSRIKGASGGRLLAHAFSYWHFMGTEFDHAGFAETSLMLAISKDIKMSHAKKGLVTDGMTKAEVRRLGRLASRSFPSVTRNGVWGDPTGATREAGAAMLDEIVKNLQKKCQTCLT